MSIDINPSMLTCILLRLVERSKAIDIGNSFTYGKAGRKPGASIYTRTISHIFMCVLYHADECKSLGRGQEKVKSVAAGIESFWGDALAESVMTQAAATETSRPALFDERSARLPRPVPPWRRPAEALGAVDALVGWCRLKHVLTRTEYDCVGVDDVLPACGAM
jgi:hypothetical protein